MSHHRQPGESKSPRSPRGLQHVQSRKLRFGMISKIKEPLSPLWLLRNKRVGRKIVRSVLYMHRFSRFSVSPRLSQKNARRLSNTSCYSCKVSYLHLQLWCDVFHLKLYQVCLVFLMANCHLPWYRNLYHRAWINPETSKSEINNHNNHNNNNNNNHLQITNGKHAQQTLIFLIFPLLLRSSIVVKPLPGKIQTQISHTSGPLVIEKLP